MVRRMALEFLKPARIDDILEVTTRVRATTAATLTLDQRISRGDLLLFSAEVMVVLMSAAGKPLRLSAHLRGALQAKKPLS
jgi:acyl-CoA thioester hydrolase